MAFSKMAVLALLALQAAATYALKPDIGVKVEAELSKPCECGNSGSIDDESVRRRSLSARYDTTVTASIELPQTLLSGAGFICQLFFTNRGGQPVTITSINSTITCDRISEQFNMPGRWDIGAGQMLGIPYNIRDFSTQPAQALFSIVATVEEQGGNTYTLPVTSKYITIVASAAAGDAESNSPRDSVGSNNFGRRRSLSAQDTATASDLNVDFEFLLPAELDIGEVTDGTVKITNHEKQAVTITSIGGNLTYGSVSCNQLSLETGWTIGAGEMIDITYYVLPPEIPSLPATASLYLEAKVQDQHGKTHTMELDRRNVQIVPLTALAAGRRAQDLCQSKDLCEACREENTSRNRVRSLSARATTAEDVDITFEFPDYMKNGKATTGFLTVVNNAKEDISIVGIGGSISYGDVSLDLVKDLSPRDIIGVGQTVKNIDYAVRSVFKVPGQIPSLPAVANLHIEAVIEDSAGGRFGKTVTHQTITLTYRDAHDPALTEVERELKSIAKKGKKKGLLGGWF